ncbi:hypothetical protein [Kosakonia sp. Marseille-Q7440]
MCHPFFLSGVPGFQKSENVKSIARDPVYTDALITKAVPGTPAFNGIVNVTLDYEFKDESGNRYIKNNIVTAVKTIEMTQYNVGATVPIVYLRSDPTQNKHTLASVLKYPFFSDANTTLNLPKEVI